MASDINRYLERTKAERHAKTKRRRALRKKPPHDPTKWFLWVGAVLVTIFWWPLGLLVMIYLAFFYQKGK